MLKVRVLADLKQSRTPRQIAGRLHLEATDDTVEPMKGSTPAQSKTASHEAIYRFIYAMPRGELARNGIFLRRKQARRRPAKRQVGAVRRPSGWSTSMSVTRARPAAECPGTGRAT